MRTPSVRALCLGVLVLYLVTSPVAPPGAAAQSGDPAGEYRGKPKPKPEAKPKRAPHPAPPRLSLRWRLVERTGDRAARDVDPTAPLHRGAAVRLVVRSEDDGYLYVLHQEEGKKPVLLFPDDRINNGQNFVAADADYNIPAYCPEEKGAEDCWQRITRRAGRGYLVVILSRERRTDVANALLQRGPIALDQARGLVVDPSGQRLARVDAREAREARVADTSSGSLAVRVTDSSSGDRQLVDVIPLNVVEAARPLALQWRLVKREKNGSSHDINPVNALTAGDDVRLLFRADQDGYLYVFQQDEGKKPVAIFPDARINDGRNFVSADQEYSVPAYCPDKTSGENCWEQITKTPGRTNLVVLFSSERGTDLYGRILAGPVAVDPASGRLVDASGQPLAKLDPRVTRTEPVAARSGFPVRVQNDDPEDKQVVDVVSLAVQPPPRPLAIQWRLVRRDKAGSAADVDPSTMFLRNDEVRFVCKAERDGFLYVLYQEEGAKPVVVFPDSRINDGRNFVAADQEYSVPAYCPEGRGAENCWQRLTRRSGRNLLIVIFGPEKDTELVGRILKSGSISLDGVASGQVVDTTSTFVLGLVSPRQPARASRPGSFVVQSVDTDPNTKEQLVDAIVINVDKRAR